MSEGAPRIGYGVLGPVELRIAGDAVPLTSARQRALLAALLLRANRHVTGDRLVDEVWGYEAPADPRSSLHTVLHRLRETLRASGTQPLRTDPAGYLLAVDADTLDATRFEDLVAKARTAPAAEAVPMLDAALDLWRGPAYEDVADRGTVQAEAVRLEELRLRAVEQRASAVLDLGDADAAVTALRPFVAEHPLREGAHLLLATAVYRTGRPTEALDQLRGYRRLLADELGLDPSPAVDDLETRILRHQLDAAPSPTGDTARHHCPSPESWRPSATAFVGREDATGDLVAALSANRLVTVVGVGGVGKTRLTAEALPEIARRLGLPVVVVELAAAAPGDVDATAARALELRAAGPSQREAIVEYLSVAALLLVLDNCEHVAPAVRGLVDHSLRGCPGVRVLATSRVPLGSPEEQVLPLSPLRAPTEGADPEYTPVVRLFVDRARRVRPSFAVTAQNLPVVVDICRRLDGLPLAVELAAARAAALGVGPLLDRLDRSLELLGGDATRAPRRPRTLRAVIDWSYDLLADQDQRLFAALGAFDGGFDLDAAERIATVDDEPTVAAGLARLVEASLVVAEEAGDTVRYRLLAVIHEYAAELLATSGRAHSVRSAHATWALSVVTAAARDATGPGDADAFARASRETANLRSAITWALANGEPELAARIARGLVLVSTHRADPELLSWVRRTADDAAVLGTDSAPLAAAAGSRAAHLQGDLAEAQRLAEWALAAGTSSTEVRYLAYHSLGVVSLYRGEHENSISWWSRLLEIDGLPAAYYVDGYLSLALLALYQGEVAEARAQAARATAAAEVCGAQAFQAFAAYVDGEISLVEDPANSLEVLQDAADRAGAADVTFVIGLAGTALASGLTRLGRHDDALARFGPLLEHWRRMGAWPQLWTTTRLIAELLAETDRPQTAALLFAAADSAPSAPAVTGTDAQRLAGLHRRIRGHLGADMHDRIIALARTLTPAEVVERALAAVTPADTAPRSMSWGGQGTRGTPTT